MSTALDMIAVEAGGVVKEDVMKKLFDLSPVDRPCIDSIGTDSAHNIKKEFTDEVLEVPSAVNTYYENQDLSGEVDNVYGQRYYNLCQQMGKTIKLSQRGQEVDTTYEQREFAKQLLKRGEALRRDEEAAAVSRNAATAEVAATSGALMAGMATWAIHNTQRGAGGADAVLDGSTNVGGGPTTAPTEGNKRALTETMLRTAIRSGWDDGAMFSHLMSTGTMIETISNYMFTSSARVATLESEVSQGNRKGVGDGNGAGAGGVVAQGSVNMFVGNFGTIILTPNRQMTTYTAADTGDVVDVLLFDKRYPVMSYLNGYKTQPISANGLYKQTTLYVDSTFIPGATRGITTIADITPGDAMTP